MKPFLQEQITILAENTPLQAVLTIPEGAGSLVIFAHGSGSSRYSPRNNFVASVLHQAGIATLLGDLLTEEENKSIDYRFDIELLTRRLVAFTGHVISDKRLHKMQIGYYGSSTGAASALKAAARLGDGISSVVSRGGRPDLALDEIGQVVSPTLFIVGGLDTEVLHLNELVYQKMNVVKELKVISGASHLFEEPGMMEQVATFAGKWFLEHFNSNVNAIH